MGSEPITATKYWKCWKCRISLQVLFTLCVSLFSTFHIKEMWHWCSISNILNPTSHNNDFHSELDENVTQAGLYFFFGSGFNWRKSILYFSVSPLHYKDNLSSPVRTHGLWGLHWDLWVIILLFPNHCEPRRNLLMWDIQSIWCGIFRICSRLVNGIAGKQKEMVDTQTTNTWVFFYSPIFPSTLTISNGGGKGGRVGGGAG